MRQIFFWHFYYSSEKVIFLYEVELSPFYFLKNIVKLVGSLIVQQTNIHTTYVFLAITVRDLQQNKKYSISAITSTYFQFNTINVIFKLKVCFCS